MNESEKLDQYNKISLKVVSIYNFYDSCRKFLKFKEQFFEAIITTFLKI